MAAIPTVPPHMLPAPNICIRDLVQFPLPLIAQDLHNPSLLEGRNISAVFLKNEPTWNERHDVVTIEVPVDKLLKRFVKAWTKAIQAGARSVRVCHTAVSCAETLPMWIVPYWQGVAAARKHQERWQSVELFLMRPHNSWWDPRGERSSVAAVMRAALEMLYQRSSNEMLQGFADPEPIERLAAFASHDWLSTWHMDLQLELLKRDLARAGKHQILVPMSYFYKSLLDAFNDKDQYGDPKFHQTVLKFGVRIVHHNFDLATVANVDENHWIAFIICRRHETVYYGDSMGNRVHSQFFEVINWWIFFHFARAFEWATMSMSKQADWFSCGILGGNGLRHFFLSRLYPLAAEGEWGADAERGDVLAQILLQDRVRRAFFGSHTLLLIPSPQFNPFFTVRFSVPPFSRNHHLQSCAWSPMRKLWRWRAKSPESCI